MNRTAPRATFSPDGAATVQRLRGGRDDALNGAEHRRATAPLAGPFAPVPADARARRRRLAEQAALFVLVSAAHLAVLAWIGLRTPFTQMRPMEDEAVVEVFLYRPPPPPRPSQVDDREETPRVIPTPYRPRLVVPVAPLAVDPIPAAPAAPAGPAGPANRPSPATEPRAWDGLREALRKSPSGCASQDYLKLTPAERELCNEALGRASNRAAPLGIDPGKQVAFDQAAAAKARARREREGAMGSPMTLCEGRASNFGLGCNPGH